MGERDDRGPEGRSKAEFTIRVCGEPVRVEYVPSHSQDRDHFAFVSPHEPPRPHPPSPTGYVFRRAPRDQAEGAGGREGFAPCTPPDS